MEVAVQHIDGYCDSNWAGCVRTRKSTTGLAIMYGGCTIRTLSKTQANIALSSAEAELHGIAKGASQALGMRSISRDLGGIMSTLLLTDASAALGIVRRRGLGKIRHLDVTDDRNRRDATK